MTYFHTNKEDIAKKKKTGQIEFTNQYTKARKLGLPKPEISDETRKRLSESTKRNNQNRPKEVIEKIRNAMKIAHQEGRAWNIGQSRWNNQPSYPEIFFMKVIENEFENKNYTREYPLGKYSLDFAWVDQKKCIEIDGDQHQRYIEYQVRDGKKDEFLKQNGWSVLRIVWKEMFSDTKTYIKICKDFIDTK